MKEEIKLLRTTKEFLVEEKQNLDLTQIDANEDFLNRLQQSIERLRNDFQQLNENQLKQIEETYRETIERLGNELKPNDKQQIEENQWENLCRSEEEILKNLYEENNHLTDEILRLESDRIDLRNEYEEDLDEKNRIFAKSQRNFGELTEKLSHLAEYDRNLKFELTLYRNVLQGEHLTNYPLRKTRSEPVEIEVDRPKSFAENFESTMNGESSLTINFIVEKLRLD